MQFRFKCQLSVSFFLWGGILKRCYEWNKTHHTKTTCMFLLFVCVGIVVLIEWLNGSPRMFNAMYGRDLMLFIIGASAGTLGVYFITRLLPSRQSKNLVTLSNGMILILGFHQLLIKFYIAVPIVYRNTVTDYIAAVVILLMFIPVIKICERFFPAILGQRSLKD